VVFDQWGKNVPFGAEPRESKLIAEQHRLLGICDSAGIKVWLVSQISSKHDYGDPAAIPLKRIGDTPVWAECVPFEAVLDSIDPRAFIKVTAESSRLYAVAVTVSGNPVQMIWMRDPEVVPNQYAHVVRVTLQPGAQKIECPTLDDTEHWFLMFRNEHGGSVVHIDSVCETAAQPKSVRKRDKTSDRIGWYNYLGVPDQGFTWSRSPRSENDILRRAVIDKHCSFLSQEFGRHISVVGTLNWSDEWGNGGHDWSFQADFPNAGSGFAAELARWAEIQAKYFHQPGLAFGDMFYREGKYSRANSARGGGFENALNYLPLATPVELIAWDDNPDSPTLLTQVEKFDGRAWAIGVYMEGKNQSRSWRRVYNQYPFSPKPTKVIFFSWNHTDYSEDHLRKEFEAWKE